MQRDELQERERFWAFLFGSIGCAALLWNLYRDPNNWPDFLVNLAQLAVAVIVFLVARSINERSITYGAGAKEALVRLQQRYPDFLLGPRYNREGYDPEKGKGQEYLFVTNEDKHSKLRAKFIPIGALDNGVLTVYVQKGTLVYGLGFSSEEATVEAIDRAQNAVSEALTSHLQKEWTTEECELLKNAQGTDAAITVAFYEETVSRKHFAKAVANCADLAVQTLRQFKKSNGAS